MNIESFLIGFFIGLILEYFIVMYLFKSMKKQKRIIEYDNRGKIVK